MDQFEPRTTRCAYCDNINPYGATTCFKCGAPLVAALPFPSTPLPPPAPDPAPQVADALGPVLPSPTMPAAQPMQTVAGPVVYRMRQYATPAKSRGTALVLEILPFFISLMGIGWLYAGNTTAGVLWLVGFLVWNAMAVLLDFLTLGIFACLHIPINIALVVVSAITLNNYTRQHPELFGV
ncbi:MAG: hypothetical protein WCF84_24590 [Anaerolineae bacterium]